MSPTDAAQLCPGLRMAEEAAGLWTESWTMEGKSHKQEGKEEAEKQFNDVQKDFKV